jgi:peroxiredoxin
VQDGGKVSDMPAVGSTAHNVALRGINGDTVRLSSMKGKFILLDFCASWSNVSAANTENLLKLYTRYKGSNLAIYQVYLEESRSAWVKYVKENKIPWTTASSVSLWNCQAAQAYGVTSLPATFLIYPDFTIQGVNMTADKLDAQLSEVLTKTSKKK